MFRPFTLLNAGFFETCKKSDRKRIFFDGCHLRPEDADGF
jgi:hypothetical protein